MKYTEELKNKKNFFPSVNEKYKNIQIQNKLYLCICSLGMIEYSKTWYFEKYGNYKQEL